MISKENGGIRASPKVLSMQPCKKFSHPSLIIYFIPTPPIKLKLGLQIGGRLITNPPGPIKPSGQSTDEPN
jgi:hypothetical protein